MRHLKIASLSLPVRYFPSFLDGLSLRRARPSQRRVCPVAFPFLLGRAFIESPKCCRYARRGAISLPFWEGLSLRHRRGRSVSNAPAFLRLRAGTFIEGAICSTPATTRTDFPSFSERLSLRLILTREGEAAGLISLPF